MSASLSGSWLGTAPSPPGSLCDPNGPPPGRPALSEGQVVAMAAGVWAGAWLGPDLPLSVSLGAAVGAAMVAVAIRHRTLVVVAVAVTAVAAGQRADAHYQPIEPAIHHGQTTVVSDPRSTGVGWRVEVALVDGQRVEATAYGAAGVMVAGVSAGDRLVVTGTLTPMPDSPWARSRHLVGRLSVDEVVAVGSPIGLRRGPDWVSRAVARGAERLSPGQRSLYLGLVVGDDRHQPWSQQARFRAAGLSHLLAVSGQNVAFVQALVAPVLRFVPRRGRVVVTVAVLVLFAAVTRFEPSVLRATVTAGVAAAATSGGHRQSGPRLLGLAVSGLVLVDPFLVHAVGFQLSVGASAGIVVVGPVLTGRLPGPSWVTGPLAVTVAAQLGVLPLLLHYFGPVSVASIPANLAAGGAAGLVMMWGLTGGVVAGVLPSPVGEWFQAPAGLVIWWLDGVAAWASRLPLPALGAGQWAVTAGMGAVAWLLPGRSVGRVAVLAMVVALSLSALPRPPAGPTELAGGAWWLPAGDGGPSVMVVPAQTGPEVLDDLLRHRVREVGVVVSVSGRGRGALVARAVTELCSVGVVLAPPQHRVVGATRVTGPVVILTGGSVVEVRPEPHRLGVTIGSGQPSG